MKIAVCDDDKSVVSQLEMILVHGKDRFIEPLEIEVFYSGEELLDTIRKTGPFELIFLDIEMDEIDGVGVGNTIRREFKDPTTKIVYISAHSHYARVLFDVQPLKFLEKPINSDEVYNIIAYAIEIYGSQNEVLEYQKGQDKYRVPLKDISYFDITGRKVTIHMKTGEDHFNDRIKTLMERLPKGVFVQLNRSQIANRDHVVRYRKSEWELINNKILYNK